MLLSLADYMQSATKIAKFRPIALFLLLLSFLAIPASALDPHKTIAQLVHTAWTGRDGAPSSIQSLAQTTDGYLWLGSASGLFRFDGVRFTRFEVPPGESFPDTTTIRVLLATRDGALWIVPRSTRVGRFLNGHLTSYSESDGLPRTRGLVEAPDGAVIAATDQGLRQFKDGKWTDVGKEWGYSGTRAQQVYFDKAGTLWVATEDRIVYRCPGRQFVDPNEPLPKGFIVYQFAQAPDSTIWLADMARPTHTLRPPGLAGALDGSSDASLDVARDRYHRTELPSVAASNVLIDRDGSLWIGTPGQGIRRIPFPDQIRGRTIREADPQVERFGIEDGMWTASVLEDREGNIWWGTDRGLDRFRDAAFTPVSIHEGDRPRSIIASRDGGLWTAALSGNEILHIAADGTQHLIKKKIAAISLFEDETGVLWLGDWGLWRREGNRLASIFPGTPISSTIWSITRDREGALWLFGMPDGLLHFSDGVLTNLSKAAGLGPVPDGGIVYTDPLGRVWIGQAERVSLYEAKGFRTFGTRDGLQPGRILAFLQDRAGNLWAGGEGGLSVFRDGRFHQLPRPSGFPARSAYGIVEDASGDWWIAIDAGVLRINPAELQKAAADPSYRVRFRSFNTLDGLPGNPRQTFPFPVICRTTGGRIWTATSNGLAFVDPAHIPKNTVPPPVHVEAVRVDGRPLAPADGIVLGRLANEIEIDYNALSLGVPERVLFRYQLEGAETQWHDAGTRRQAFYNHLDPKQYKFHVIACNNDGVWNEQGATLAFSIAPAFYQTRWFEFLCIVAAGSLVWTVYRWRVRQVTDRLDLQFRERLGERMRIAQELHDTLLQGFISAAMQLSVANDQLPADWQAKPLVNKTLELVRRVVDEGRAAVQGMRLSGQGAEDLEEAFSRVPRELGVEVATSFRIVVEGRARPLHPLVRDEVYRIGREALVNALRHSQAAAIEVELNYTDRRLTVVVRDDGNGIDPEVLRQGRRGHWGLLGMRERAERIGAQIAIRSQLGGGTEVELSVPGEIAFRLDSSVRGRPGGMA
jgi:signal transduction histidine kinase/ligand-binding sensor domain-containing protein